MERVYRDMPMKSVRVEESVGQKKGGSNTDWLPDISDTVSFHECTGLMPTPPRDREQLLSYKALFTMALPEPEE